MATTKAKAAPRARVLQKRYRAKLTPVTLRRLQIEARMAALQKSIKRLQAEVARSATEAAKPRAVAARPRGRTAIDEALREGVSFKQAELMREEMLSSDEAARYLGLSRETLNQRRKTARVLALEGAKRGMRYPSWQFETNVWPALPRILETLKHLDPWGHYLFLTRPEPLLRGATPLRSLQEGKADEVIEIAERLAADAGA